MAAQARKGRILIRHIALFRYRPELSESEKTELCRAVDEFLASWEEKISGHCGPDLALREGNYDFGICVDFADEQSYLAYASHPHHLELLAKHIAPTTVARAAMQFAF